MGPYYRCKFLRISHFIFRVMVGKRTKPSDLTGIVILKKRLAVLVHNYFMTILPQKSLFQKTFLATFPCFDFYNSSAIKKRYFLELRKCNETLKTRI